MNQMMRPLLGLAAFIFLINWGGAETSVTGGRKNTINFYGTLTTQQGKTLELENISIAYLYKDIPVYDVPLETSEKIPFIDKKRTASQDHLVKKYSLFKDPRSGIITKINLANVHEIRIPQPDTLWVLKRKKGMHPIEFVQIEVISNDAVKTKNNYFIEFNRKLIADQINEAGPIEKDVPLQAIKSLTMKGYTHRDEQKEQANKNRK